MRRSLDPEGYEDHGIKGSHLSLGEMSSEWLPRVRGDAGHVWAPALHGGMALHGHQSRAGASVAEVMAWHG